MHAFMAAHMESVPLSETTTAPAKSKPPLLWFNRVGLVLSLLTLPVFIGSLIVGWNLAQGSDWYYCLLAALMLMAVTSLALECVFLPISLLFWLIDGRYPMKRRLVSSCHTFLWNAVQLGILYGVFWLLATHHIGTPPQLPFP
jgi:hypothetical protein